MDSAIDEYGIVIGCVSPPDAFCALRSYVRQRERVIKDRSRQVLHMQKALMQMNVQLDNVLLNIVGQTGLAIFRAIVAGERAPPMSWLSSAMARQSFGGRCGSQFGR